MKNNEKRTIAVLFKTTNPADNSSTVASAESQMTKIDMMNMVSEWWNNYGTHFEDYQELHMKFVSPPKKEEHKNE